jgi:hypothetical protein
VNRNSDVSTLELTSVSLGVKVRLEDINNVIDIGIDIGIDTCTGSDRNYFSSRLVLFPSVGRHAS